MKIRLGLFFLTITLALTFVFVSFNRQTSASDRTPSASYLTIEPGVRTVSFEGYSKMGRKRDRNVTFSKESALNKSLLWRQHLAYYETKLNLNEKQKGFLKRVAGLLDERFFAAPIQMSEAEYVKTARGKPFKELMQNVSKLFTPQQASQLFLVIGDTSTVTDWGCGAAKVPTRESNEPRTSGPNNSEPDSGNNPNLPFTTCTCTGSLCGSGCPMGYTCKAGWPSPNCDVGGECGCFGWFNCVGLCYSDWPEN